MIFFQRNTTQTARDIKVNFILNESLSKREFRSMIGHSSALVDSPKILINILTLASLLIGQIEKTFFFAK
jgi:hypothetical protein